MKVVTFCRMLSTVVLSLPFVFAFKPMFRPRHYRYQVVMNTEWSQIKVKLNERDGEGLRFISIEASSEICNLYKIPGQYVQIRKSAESKPGFYAIANPPTIDSTTLSFLVKETENNIDVTSASIGSVLEMSNPLGKVSSFLQNVNNVVICCFFYCRASLRKNISTSTSLNTLSAKSSCWHAAPA